MKHILPSVIPVLALNLLLTNCASIVGKSSYPVSITSTPSAANVTITNKKGVAVHSGLTPTTVTLKSSAGFFQNERYTLTFSKPGHTSRSVPLKAGISGWYAGNIIFGGLVGILIVDPLTGAMWRLNDKVHADLGAGQAVTSTPGGHSLRVVNRADIPASWEGNLVALNQP
ncbi:MAG: hypothetical protein ACO1TE_00280 [Prosthecobacter sp.]